MTQKQEVTLQLNLNAQVSRNWALQKRITRLASIINQLKKEGWDFETEERSGDYVYKVSYTREQVKLDLATLNYQLV